MKKNLFIPAVALLLLSGCNYNEENFKGLDEMTQPENVINVDYTLTAEDYKSFDKKSSPYLNSYFTSDTEADELFPAWLAKKYYTASPTSVVRAIFNYMDAPSELLKPYTNISYIGLEKNEDYVPTFYPVGTYAPYLNATTVTEIGDKLLKSTYPNAKKGDLVMVGYNYNESAIPQQIETPVVNYDFDNLPKGDITSISGGWYLKTPEEKLWSASSYNGNGYVQYSANGAKGVCEAWLVTPEVKVESADKNLGFDITIGYWNADCLTILISTDFDGKDVTKATWDDVTSAYAPTATDKPTNGYAKKAVSTKVSLAAYGGKVVRVAFKYVGDGANKKTTTYQIDNVVIGKDIPKAVTTSPQFKLFEYNSTDKKWNEFVNSKTSKVLSPLYTDYKEMGAPGTNMYFSSTVKPEDYIPAYLNSWTLYPQDGDARVVIYRYYNSDKKLEAQAKEYIYSAVAGRWEYNTQIVSKTRQYAFDGSKWLFDPSTTVTLKAKGDKPTSDFYQIITDWVKANKGAEYVTSFGNNDYYYGGSAYNNNFDFRPSAWKAQNAVAYGNMSDADLKALMMTRLPEAFLPGLEATYPNAEPVEGVNVIYTVNFFVYDGSVTTSWTIKYEVKEKGKFTYVENSLAEVK